jgi:hypothetical protein
MVLLFLNIAGRATLGRCHVPPFTCPHAARAHACKPLELLHTNIAGPLSVASACLAKSFVTVLDDFTHFKAVKPITKKSEAHGFIKEIIQN